MISHAVIGYTAGCYLIHFVSVSVKNQYQLGTVLKILSAPLKHRVSGQRYRKSFLSLSVPLALIHSTVQKGFLVPLNAIKIGYF